MRYIIYFDKAINQLVPHYIGGRKLILYLQSLMSPLQSLNTAFSDYAKETRIEASMTSQIFKFEWYLNRKFNKYFKDSSQKISIRTNKVLGTPIYNENARGISLEDNFKLIYEGNSAEQSLPSVLHNRGENIESIHYSFEVNSPAIDYTIFIKDVDEEDLTEEQKQKAEDQYKSMLSAIIEKYRLAGKTYIINIVK